MRVRSHPVAVTAVIAVAFGCALVLLLLRVENRIGEGTFAVAVLGVVAAAGAAVIMQARSAARSFKSTLQRAEAALGERRVAASRLETLVASLGEGVIVTTADGRIEAANAAAHSILGYEDNDLAERQVGDVLSGHAEAREPTLPGIPREAAFRRADGSNVAVSYTVSTLTGSDGADRVVYALQNIEERKRVEQRIRNLARIDPLTKIANRMQFQHLLQQAIARAKRSNRYVALLYLDVDRFKDINDTFGHAVGDSSLEIFSRRIQAELDEGSIAGRLAGDEFAVLATSSAHMGEFVEQVSDLAGRLLRAVGQPFEAQGEEVFMTTSIGIALYPRDADNVIDLIRHADAALYRSKKAGGNGHEFYSSEMSTAAVERLMLKSKLRRAFERDELRLHYQPKYNVRTGRIEGAEALVRWDLPERGLVYPSDFIPLAEETNLILQIGDWVLNRVCADYRDWQKLMPSPCRVSVNLSLRQLLQQRFLDKIRETFRAHGVSPTSLELEITETTLMEDTARTIRILNSLYGMGLHLAIDDFGTGYSSLSALQQFPIDTLKIDQSFIRNVAIDHDDAAIVATIIRMGHSLKLDVVAEGVESEEQLDFLRRHNCDYVQGHLFGDPVDATAFAEMLVSEVDGTNKYRALFARAEIG